VVDDHGDIPVVNSFEELKDMISVQLGEVDIKLT
jgi:hypothetical protein